MNWIKVLFRYYVAVLFAQAMPFASIAQDTLHITLKDAEEQFVQKNLSLLASKYNIEAAKAMIIQAKLYNNPTLSMSGSIYNREQKKLFDVSNKTGEYIVGVQQLILLAGKRSKQVKLAETRAQLAEYDFYDLLRTLRFTLRSNFYDILFLQNSYRAYQMQVSSLEKLNKAYEELQAKGVVTLKDAVRIKSLLYSLKAEQTGLQNQINDLQAELQLLLQNNRAYFVLVDGDKTGPFLWKQYTLESLIDTAYVNRFDLKAAEANTIYSRQNYSLAKAFSVPDLILGAEFDKRGSFVENASFFNIAIDLPFFNRNQGNIKAARIDIDQNKILYQNQRLIIENQVQKAWLKAFNTDKTLQSFDPAFKDQFERLLNGVIENFQKKNISLLEFTDFYESYRNNILQLNQLQNERMQAVETLNFSLGKSLFN